MGYIDKIVTFDFPDNQYYKEEHAKKQIFLHHTVSGEGAAGDINYWKSTPEHVATCVVVGRDGTINQCFSSKYWAYHLGIDASHTAKYKSKNISNPNDVLNKGSIGIEIDSWGGLIKNENGEWCVPKYDANLNKNVASKIIIPSSKVVEYPEGFRGWKGFEKYTDEQIAAVKELILLWKEKYGIDTTYHSDIWDICPRAYDFQNGIFTHVSVRKDKSDCHPQIELINMLKSL